MGVREVKPIFQDNAENIGNRDCMVLPTSGEANVQLIPSPPPNRIN